MVAGISNKLKVILGAISAGLMVFAFFCPPSPYEQVALVLGILCVLLLAYVALAPNMTKAEEQTTEWLIDPASLPDSVVLSDLHGNIKAFNTSAVRLIPGCSEKEHIQRVFNDWHNNLENKQQADDVVDAVLLAPEMQFSETLYFKNGKVIERVTRPLSNKTGRLWLLRDVTHQQIARAESEMHNLMLEADAARTAELAEQLFHAKSELEAKQAELRRLANTDSLTGLLNRRRFTVLGEKIVKSAATDDIWVIMMDIDHFKQINDTYGHAAGDIAIRDFANIIITEVGNTGFVGRMGGEEFAAVLESCNRDKAVLIAENIRKKTAHHQTISDSEKFRFTCSIGVAQWVKGEITIEAALDRSDKALYSAKSFGRNRVVGYELELQ